MEEQFVDEKILYISPAIQALITENSNSEAAQLLAALADKNGYKVQDYVDDPERRWKPGYVGCISVGMRGETIEISEPSQIAPVLRRILANVDLESARKIQKKTLAISRAVGDLIESDPAAAALLERLKKEQGYEVQDVVEYGTDKSGVIGHIVTTHTETATDYVINSADGIIQVLSKILSPENSAAPHSPPVSTAPTEPSYQHSVGAPASQKMNEGGDAERLLLRASGDRSADYEPDPENGGLKLTGLAPQSFSAKWCSWFPCCCNEDDEQRNPLLSPAPKRN